MAVLVKWPASAVCASLSLALLADSASAGPRVRPVSLVGGEQVYSLAMHQHGSLSEGEGSMEWHAAKAHATGVADVIWWTEHDWRVSHWSHTQRFDFENAPIGPTPLSVTEPDDAYPGETRSWDRSFPFSAQYAAAVVDTAASEGSRSWRLRGTDPVGEPWFRTIYFAQNSSRKQQMYSLAARIRVRFSVRPEAIGADSRFVFEARLSEHPTEWHVLRYVLGSMDGEGANAIALPFTPGVWNSFEVDLTADAIAKFTTGGADTLRAEDNNMFAISIGVEVRNGATAIAFFDDYQILHDSSLDGNPLLDKARAFGELYETMYPSVSHFVGTEVSKYRAQPHMNGYAPDLDLVDYTGTIHSDTLYYAVDQIHAQGGCVSLNHVYGPGFLGNPAETPEEEAARIVYWKRKLIATRVFRTDLLEVGYRLRHGIELVKFLDTWDAVTGNSVFVTANGVSDSHGSNFYDGWGPYDPTDYNFTNNFVTWVHATDLSEAALIDGLLSGRAFFGDPFAWYGSLDLLTADGFPMGRVVLTDRDEHQLIVEATNVSPTAHVRLVQGEIREDPPVEYLNVSWIRDEILGASITDGVLADTVSIDTTTPSFVRVELANGGEYVAFSNPIHFVRDVPGLGIRAPRIAASLDSTQIVDAAKFTMLDASFDAQGPSLTIFGDEDAPGLGSLTIDPGPFGEPVSIAGATSWNFDGALVTASGFSGVGSTVTLSWGAVGAPVLTPPVALALSVRNPFEDRARIRYALPRAGQVFLEVLDVQGRRVRVLIDERREAGWHESVWDGRDPYGHGTASGVYFLRLSVAGETLSDKLVKIR